VAGTTQSTTGESGYFLGVSAGIGGKPLRQQRAPGVIPMIQRPPGALTKR